MKRHLVGFGLGILLVAAPAATAEMVYGRVFHTLEGKVFADARVTLLGRTPQSTSTDRYGQYWLRDVRPGAYLVQLEIPGRPPVTSRLVVGTGTTIAHLDLSKIGHPDHDDEY